MTVYQKIDRVLTQHTEAEKDEVCDRVCALYDKELTIMKARKV